MDGVFEERILAPEATDQFLWCVLQQGLLSVLFF